MPEMGSSLARAGAGGDTEAQGKRAQAIAGLKAPFRAATGAAHFTGADCMALLGSGNMEANQPIEEPISSRPRNSAIMAPSTFILAPFLLWNWGKGWLSEALGQGPGTQYLAMAGGNRSVCAGGVGRGELFGHVLGALDFFVARHLYSGSPYS